MSDEKAGPDYVPLDEAALTYMERTAGANLADRIDVAKCTVERVEKFLALALSGAAGALLLALSTARPQWAVVPAFAVSGWLFFVSIVLAATTWMSREFPALGNSPQPLLNYRGTLQDLRHAQLKVVQLAIRMAADVNHHRAFWLDWCRVLVCLTPVVAILAARFS